jgi:hypothetical protein
MFLLKIMPRVLSIWSQISHCLKLAKSGVCEVVHLKSMIFISQTISLVYCTEFHRISNYNWLYMIYTIHHIIYRATTDNIICNITYNYV